MRLPATRARRRSTVLGEPFLRAVSTGAPTAAEPDPEPPQSTEAPAAQTVDPFRGMVNLLDRCLEAEAEIAEIEETLARDPDALSPEAIVAPVQKLLDETQSDIQRLPPGEASQRVVEAARREGLALSGRVLEADARADRRFKEGTITAAADRLAAKVAQDPGALEASLTMLNDLIDTADLDASDKRLVAANLEARVRDAAGGEGQLATRDFVADAQELESRIGTVRPSAARFPGLTEDERAELAGVIERLRDLEAPADVIDTTLRDVARQVQRSRSTAMDPVTGAAALGGLIITGLLATSLETQRRRAEQDGLGDDTLAAFDRLIDDVRSFAGESAVGDGTEEDDDDSDRQSVVPRPEQPIAASPTEEPPPNPEDDPLFILMTQTIAGQIVEKGLGESSVVREAIERHAKQLLPKIRDLYPGGIQEEELRRIIPLGSDPDIDDFRPLEVSTAVLLERHLGTKLTRSDRGGDWMDPRTLETYDAILGNIPDPKFYKFRGFVKSLRKHLEKPDVDHIVVDVTPLNTAQKGEVKEYINTELSTDEFIKIMIVE